MSHCRNIGRVLFAAVSVGLIIFLSSAVAAQETPKSEVFIGYQWLNPGGTVPEAFQPSNAPVGIKPPSMGKGFGASYTYNFTKILGLEGDFGHNWSDFGYESTLSVGPKLTWRQENIDLFIHGLAGYNRFVENGITPKNGFGLIGGGGMDLKVSKRLSIRVRSITSMMSWRPRSMICNGLL